MVNGLPITLSATRDPTEIPWKDTGVRAQRSGSGGHAAATTCYILQGASEHHEGEHLFSQTTVHAVQLQLAEDACRYDLHRLCFWLRRVVFVPFAFPSVL